jgi:hypothetical protein
MTKQPIIGIWWDDGKNIASFMHWPEKPDLETGLCDSDYSHNDLWPDAACQFGIGSDVEYFSVPRGRVLWDAKKRQSIIYHGNATAIDRLKIIAKEFGLLKWISKRDTHYAIGGEADELFEDE